MQSQIVSFKTESELKTWLNKLLNLNQGWTILQMIDNQSFPCVVTVFYDSRIKSAYLNFFPFNSIDGYQIAADTKGAPVAIKKPFPIHALSLEETLTIKIKELL